MNPVERRLASVIVTSDEPGLLMFDLLYWLISLVWLLCQTKLAKPLRLSWLRDPMRNKRLSSAHFLTVARLRFLRPAPPIKIRRLVGTRRTMLEHHH